MALETTSCFCIKHLVPEVDKVSQEYCASFFLSYQDVYDIYNVYIFVQNNKTMLAPVDLILQRMNYMPDSFSCSVFRIYAKEGLSWNDYLKLSLLFAFCPIERLIPLILPMYGYSFNTIFFKDLEEIFKEFNEKFYDEVTLKNLYLSKVPNILVPVNSDSIGEFVTKAPQLFYPIIKFKQQIQQNLIPRSTFNNVLMRLSRIDILRKYRETTGKDYTTKYIKFKSFFTCSKNPYHYDYETDCNNETGGFAYSRQLSNILNDLKMIYQPKVLTNRQLKLVQQQGESFTFTRPYYNNNNGERKKSQLGQRSSETSTEGSYSSPVVPFKFPQITYTTSENYNNVSDDQLFHIGCASYAIPILYSASDDKSNFDTSSAAVTGNSMFIQKR